MMLWQMRRVLNRAAVPRLPQRQQQHTGAACWVRFFSTTQRLAAPQRATSSRNKKGTPETRTKTSSPRASSASSRNITSHSRGAVNRGKGMKGATTDTDIAEEERRLVEGDTRLAMRLLMQHHFLYQHNTRRPEEQRIEEERQVLREKHRSRMERIEQKTRNSMELGSDVSVDGILPLYRRSKTPSAESSASSSSWMRLNPVEAEAAGDDGDEEDAGFGPTVECLMTPNMTVYNAEHDQRIRSVEVLEEEQKRRREELKSGSATNKLWSSEELEYGCGLTPQRVVQSQMLDDEDQDFAVEAYANYNEE